MHVGYAPILQNPNHALSDAEVYRQELCLAEMAEPLGFDSIWTVEHHFTDYTMCHFSYAGMPYDEAERNMQCFTKHVLPALKKWNTTPLTEPKELAISAG
jgi:alkanesulfonate monooxygenase SsuD/methylene tetrahydromethanopterin reductase-like flavin-dependent oxidoreductase (luciferase family)